MAKNLRAKIEESDTLIVYDVNADATKKLQEEAGNVEVAQSVREVAEKAVRQFNSILKHSAIVKMNPNCSIYDLSWQLRLFL